MSIASETVDAVVADLDTRWGVDAAWLFGSRASGNERSESDLDLAVLFRRRPDPVALLEARADLARLAGVPVDVVDLDVASPIIARQALKFGRLVAANHPRRRIDFTARLPGRYEDLLISRRGVEEAIMRRMSHGRT